MKNNAEFKMLSHLKNVGFATMYNFQTWTRKTSNDLEQSLDAPAKTLRKLLRKELIYKIPVKPEIGRLHRYDTFYAPVGYKKDFIAWRELMHDSGISDILLAFVYLFPDYTVSIKREPIFSFQKKNINPDAWIHMVNPSGKVYDFLLEFENSREPNEVKSKCLDKYTCKSLEELGLDEHAKVLVVVSSEHFNGFWRPIDYHKDDIQKKINSISTKINTLLTKYPSNKHFFRYMKFSDFPDLNKPVWYTNQGLRTQLIN